MIYRSLFTILVLSSTLLMYGCSGFNQSFGRRAPIIATKFETVCDFVPIENAEEDDDILRCGRAPLLPEYFDPYQPLLSDYVLSRGDVIEVAVYGHGDTEVKEAVIAPDGNLYYLFLDPIHAEGKTIEDLQVLLSKELEKFFVTPEAIITPKYVGKTTYNILGKVRRPGSYPIKTSITVQQAIGDAGGISLGGFAGTTINSSNLRESFIVRDGVKLDVDFERLVFTDGLNQNIFIRPGDYIYVASSLVQEVFLMGAVREQKPIPYKDGLTLSALLAGAAGTVEGWRNDAHITEVLIVRGSLDCPRTYQVNMLEILQGAARDVYLLPGDLVYVQPKPFKFGRSLVRMAINTFVSTFAINISSGYSNRDIFLNNTD